MTTRQEFDQDWARALTYNPSGLDELCRSECERMESLLQDVPSYDALIAESLSALESYCADVPSWEILSRYYLEV